LPDEDRVISQSLSQSLQGGGVEIFCKSVLKNLKKSKTGSTILLYGSEEKSITVERVLISSRKPNVDLNLGNAGVKLDHEGFIAVDNNLKTSADRIYAIGDVTGGRQLSYAATAMGIVAAENAMGKKSTFKPNLIPRGLWTFPEVASVGLTEEKAQEQDPDVEIGVCPLSINGAAMAYDETEGRVKVISGSRYGEILGIHIVGSHATELIWGASLALQFDATVEDLAYSLALHPTFSEAIPMAGQEARGWALYLPNN
jgi:dihydrolipoamide dehydrogenase